MMKQGRHATFELRKGDQEEHFWLTFFSFEVKPDNGRDCMSDCNPAAAGRTSDRTGKVK
jgi:hypothetical protein